MKIIIVAVLIVSALFAGCLSEKNTISKKDIILDIEPSNIKMKNGETKQIKVRVNNPGESSIYAVIRFNINSSDKPYLNFNPENYSIGSLRPGEDSGFKIVDIRANLAAGEEIRYKARAQVIHDGRIIENKDIVITVVR